MLVCVSSFVLVEISDVECNYIYISSSVPEVLGVFPVP